MAFKTEADEIRAVGKILEEGLPVSGAEAGELVSRLRLGAGRGRGRIRGQDSPAIDVAFPVHENHAEKVAAAFGLTHLRGPAFAVI